MAAIVRGAWRVQVVGWAAVLLVLTGCQQSADDDEPAGAPSVTESVATQSPTPTPSETSPVEKESAEDFIRRWAQVEMEMENSGDTEEYLALSPGCRACTDLATTVEGYYAAGGFVNWGGWDIQRIVPKRGQRLTYQVYVDSRPTKYKARRGAAVSTLKGGPDVKLMRLRRAQGGWVVVYKAQVPW